jgi:predicted amidohydrolase
VRIAIAQVDCALGDVPENARRAVDLIAKARAQQAGLVIFPELSLSGYSLGELGDDVAMAADDPVMLSLAEHSSDIDVAVGFVEQGTVHTYNSMAYLQAGEVSHVQRKAYLPTYGRFDERKHFSPGQSLTAFETRLGRVALIICNDAWQPCVPFIAVQDGARILLVPACSSTPVEPADASAIRRDWHHLLHFHARFLQTYVVFANRVGTEAGLTFWGGSQVIDPWGDTVAQAPEYEPDLLVCDLDLTVVRHARRALPLVKEARLGLLSRELERLTSSGGDM